MGVGVGVGVRAWGCMRACVRACVCASKVQNSTCVKTASILVPKLD
ncbi:hypothetical protein GYH30_032229 [Glycine max]|nr:hypothetical protein GYH30_032229 [Glycine max]